MVGIDTNILVRYIVRDDRLQAEASDRLLHQFTPQNQAWLSIIVFCELVWLLERGYRYSREQIVDTLNFLLDAQEIEIQNRELIIKTAQAYRTTKQDFSDILIVHLASKAGISKTMTFDKKAAKMAGMTLLTTEKPSP